ncbi:putative signal peptide protein [Cryptosporidium canis]|uniref:Signal peptide protein n=1 Tax=Cryptosporidium canis TaxID=195482 RepID=A0A9D5DJ13_9CRYT|nr:putative signal peptide protein [Cryptosporidium canis]
MKNIVKAIFCLLLGLVSVRSLSLRAGGPDIAVANDDISGIFDGLPLRKIEVRSPVSGVLSKVNILQTGYHSSGTAYVVTAGSSQYYKSTINTGGKNVSVKRAIEAGRNVYIQIFRESYVTFYTSKAVGDNVSQYDLLAILYVVKTRPGEAPVVKKLPRSVPTLPISNPSALSTIVDLEATTASTDAGSAQESESAVSGVEAAQESEEKLQLPEEISSTVEAERISDEAQSDESSNFTEAQRSKEADVSEKVESTQEELVSIPERSELESVPEKEVREGEYSELSDFASDSEESKGASSSQKSELAPEPTSVVSAESESQAQAQALKSEASIEPVSGVESEEIRVLAEQGGLEPFGLTQGGAVVTETRMVGISEVNQDVTNSDPNMKTEEAVTVSETVASEKSPEQEPSNDVNMADAASPAESPVDSPTGSPVESPAEPAVESPIESPAESPIDSPVESPAEPAAESSADSQVKTQTKDESIDENKEDESLAGLPPQPIPEAVESERIDDLDEPEPSESVEGSGDGDASLDSAGRMIGSDVENSGSDVTNN